MKEIRRIGKHRGVENFPDLKLLEEAAGKYEYEQIQASSMQKGQLIYMLSMGIEKDVIDKIMAEYCSTYDLDFIRIIYFITGDIGFITDQIINVRSIIYEDVLDNALEFAIEKRHPEYREITEKSVELQHKEEMLKLRADFMENQNKYLLTEIKARQEEKKLRSEIADIKKESFEEERKKKEEEISRLNDDIRELQQKLEAAETNRNKAESNRAEIEKKLDEAEQKIKTLSAPVEKEDDKEKETGQTVGPEILKEILERIDSARDDIRNEISNAKEEILSGCQKESREAESAEKGEGINEDLQQIKGKLAETISGLDKLSVSLETRDSILNKTSGGLSSVRSNIDLLTANSNLVCDSIVRIESTLREVRAALSVLKNKKKSGIFSFLSESDEEEKSCKPEVGIEKEVVPIGKTEQQFSYEDMILKLIGNPNLTQEQYNMLLYCVDQKLPEQDFYKIASILDKEENKNIDAVRLEAAIRFYFAQNNMIYGYVKKSENPVRSKDSPGREEHNDQSDQTNPKQEAKGQVHKASPESTYMVFDAVEGDASEE